MANGIAGDASNVTSIRWLDEVREGTWLSFCEPEFRQSLLSLKRRICEKDSKLQDSLKLCAVLEIYSCSYGDLPRPRQIQCSENPYETMDAQLGSTYYPCRQLKSQAPSQSLHLLEVSLAQPPPSKKATWRRIRR